MHFLERITKIGFLLIFVFLLYESFSQNSLHIAQESDFSKIKIANDRLFWEIEIGQRNLESMRELSGKKDRFFNYPLAGMFIGSSSTHLFGGNLGPSSIKTFAQCNLLLLMCVFVLLLVWIDIEFGFMSSFFASLAILFSPYYVISSKFIAVSLWSLLLPSVVVAILLMVERLNKTYLQKQILACLFITIFLRLVISYRTSVFMMFSVLVILFYHALYYMWKKKFSFVRAGSFIKTMLFAFFCVFLLQFGVDVIFYKTKISTSFLNIVNAFIFDDAIRTVGLNNAFVDILKNVDIYPHVNAVAILTCFLVISVISFYFYYHVKKVHQRQFYSLFFMSLCSFLMAFCSAFLEIKGPFYMALIWMYPSTIFTFAMLGLLMKNVYFHFRSKLDPPSENANVDNKSAL